MLRCKGKYYLEYFRICFVFIWEIRILEGRKEGKGCETGEREVRDFGVLGGFYFSCF